MNGHRWRRSLILFCLTWLLTLSLGVGWGTAQSSPPVANPQRAALVAEATRLYEQGNYAQAEGLWQQAIAAYAGDPLNQLNQAMAYSNLSLTYQQRHQFPEAQQAIDNSLRLLKYNFQKPEALVRRDPDYLKVLAQTLDILGRLYWQQGQIDFALPAWQQSARLYQILGQTPLKLQSQLHQVQALQAQGNLIAARDLLEQIEPQISQQSDLLLQVNLWRSLGNTYRLLGDLKTAKEKLDEASKLISLEEMPEIAIEQGNLAWAIANRARRIETKRKQAEAAEQTRAALQHYTQASQSSKLAVTARLNQLGLLIDAGKFAAADALWPTLEPTINALPNNHPALLARLTYAQHLICLKRRDQTTVPLCGQPFVAAAGEKRTKDQQRLEIDNLDWPTIAQIVAKVAQEAQQLEDVHARSYALGLLGTLYELGGQFTEAQSLTRQAIALAQSRQMDDLAYRWQWQQGRLLKKQGDRTGAIVAYEAAIKTLDPVRGNLLPASSDVQFDFRDNVEPLYRELVDLLLPLNDSDPVSQEDLKKAVNYIDALQLAEIEDYLRCNLAQRVQVNETDDRNTAIIHAILLEDRLAVIAKFPDAPLTLHSTSDREINIPDTIEKLQAALRQPDRSPSVRRYGEVLHNGIIKPLESALESQPQVDTLVFVLDDVLRNIPMAALYDGQQYLVDRYATALTPSTQLFKPTPTPDKMAIFLGGVNAQPPFVDVEDNQEVTHAGIQVQAELEKIQQTDIVGQSVKLMDDQFTIANLSTTLAPGQFSTIHIKTHGKFSSDPEETFLQAYQQLIRGPKLGNLLEISSQDRANPLDLLVLSACQTAEGDDRAVLGLAGIAVRSGARSTLSTLWKAQDVPNIDLMAQFYQALSQPGITKAKALQSAQRSLKDQDRRPYYWAPYVLVGSWL